MDVENKEIILIGDFNCDWDPEKDRIQTILRALQLPTNLNHY